MEWVFWTSLVLVVYTYAGYPLVLLALSWFGKCLGRGKKDSEKEMTNLSVSVVLVVHNEEERVSGRIENLLQSDYAGLEEVLVICDRCDDNTAAVAASVEGDGQGRRVRVLELEGGKEGKAAGVNQGIATARGELVVLADVRQRFERDTISRLVARFSDEKVGAVSGSLEIAPSDEVAGEGLDVYWWLEKLIREKESDIGSAIGCTGAVYAVRGDTYEAIDEDTILDDVVVPMKIALAGYRVLFEPQAKALDSQSLDRKSELRRKVRTLAGNWQMLMRYPGWLLPWANRLVWQLVSHKYIRLFGPVFLLVALVCNLLLLGGHWIYWLTFMWQVLCYSLGIAGLYEVSFPWKPLLLLSRITSGFLFLQVLCVKGFVRWIRGQGPSTGW
jgi:cellulose synthase/poly-beta-1,6-N-acetylglucosamine synthase-like glycosyltransferase